MYAPASATDDTTRERLSLLREAIEARRKLRVDYRDVKGQDSTRVLRPLACLYWDSAWTLAAWCELRLDFRSFRIDRLRELQVLDEGFRDEPGKTLADMQRAYESGAR